VPTGSRRPGHPQEVPLQNRCCCGYPGRRWSVGTAHPTLSDCWPEY